ncbi:YhgE/Pip domain-containing protein [Romboutsia sp. CE17]|uniref:YhgE/Pip domain-containing protein n=1 Tax=Romboutsia sp. CE17 TaxID=2724150 RepID=UPI001442D7B9|nr:YhgE/Pip domain-containing protein [Romboutsia sp. CE17]QJA08855.1 YhgE/Pip domain-containing protein [Romboutsia sp. CE17]
MKNVFKIFKKDLKDIFTNFALLTIIIGLAVLPSLYAWFNIKASWDPYGNTANIKVAVVNEDKGAKIFDKDINVGDKLIEKLKDNSSLGWQFVNKNTASKGVENGTYYASIEIPSDFSTNLTSLVSSDVKKGEIIYTVNEKINAIAPKITDKGASTIQLEINQTVVKTVSEIMFEALNEIGVSLENELPKLTQVENSLKEVQNKFKDIDKTIDLADDATVQIADIVKSLQNDMPAIKTTIENSMGLSEDVKTFLSDTKTSIESISPVIKSDLEILNSVSSSASTAVSDIIDAINKGYENAPELIDSLSNKLSSLASTSDTLTNFLIKLDKLTPGNSLQGVIAQLESINDKLNSAISGLDTIKNQVANGQTPSLSNLNGILKVTQDINSITSNILNNFDSKIVNPINNIFDKGFTVANNVLDVLNRAEDKLPKVDEALSTALEFSGSANDTVNFIKDKMPMAKNIVDELVDAISKVNNSDDMKELINLLQSDIITRSDFLKQPVDVVTNSLYPVKNYGSAMTPFYTVLSLWVGVLLLCSLLSTEVHGEYKPYEVYFGRGLTFLTIALIQALIVSLGDIFLLKVSMVNPLLFVLLSLFTALVFTFIVYSLVSVFGNVGKAIGVVLLVIQVAGSGGTFPIQVTPKFFQMVNPLLPFTYAISAQREAIAGVYMPNLNKDIIALLIFLVIFIVLNVILKGPINKVMYKFTKKLSESNLTEH